MCFEEEQNECSVEDVDNIKEEDSRMVGSNAQNVEKPTELDKSNEASVTACKEEVLGESSNNLVTLSVDIQPSTLESPQSPIFVKKYYERVKVESDLSSDEEFRVNITKEVHSGEPNNGREEHIASGPRTPEAERASLCTPTSKYAMSEEESDGKPLKRDVHISKKQRLLPRQYQIEEDLGIEKREFPRLREHKDPSRIDKRHFSGPRSPSPHGHHRRHRYSPLPEYIEKRWHHGNRPVSPGLYVPQQFSRSSPGYSGSPPYRHPSSSPPRPRYWV